MNLLTLVNIWHDRGCVQRLFGSSPGFPTAKVVNFPVITKDFPRVNFS